MIEIKPYAPAFEEQHILFAKKYWTKRRRFTPEYIYWKFRGKENEHLKSFLLAFDGDKVVGQFGLVPAEVVINQTIYEAQWACDLMVDHEYRGKGVAEKLYEFAHASCRITLGSDPSPAAEKSMLRKGYVSLLGPRKFIFPVKLGEIFKLKGFNNRFLNAIPNPFLIVVNCFANGSFHKIKSKEYLGIRAQQVENKIHCHYNEAFAAWRFSPFEKYYGGIQCYRGKKGIFSGYFANGVYYLTDFDTKTVFQLLSVIGFICRKYRNEKITRIKFLGNSKNISALLPFLGFIRFRTLTKVILYTKESDIREKAIINEFYYTLFDSDENI